MVILALSITSNLNRICDFCTLFKVSWYYCWKPVRLWIVKVLDVGFIYLYLLFSSVIASRPTGWDFYVNVLDFKPFNLFYSIVEWWGVWVVSSKPKLSTIGLTNPIVLKISIVLFKVNIHNICYNYWHFLLFVSNYHCFKPWNSCNLYHSSFSLDFSDSFDWVMSLWMFGCMFGVIAFGFLGI